MILNFPEFSTWKPQVSKRFCKTILGEGFHSAKNKALGYLKALYHHRMLYKKCLVISTFEREGLFSVDTLRSLLDNVELHVWIHFLSNEFKEKASKKFLRLRHVDKWLDSEKCYKLGWQGSNR